MERTKFTLDLDGDVYEALKFIKENEGRTMSFVINKILRDVLIDEVTGALSLAIAPAASEEIN